MLNYDSLFKPSETRNIGTQDSFAREQHVSEKKESKLEIKEEIEFDKKKIDFSVLPDTSAYDQKGPQFDRHFCIQKIMNLHCVDITFSPKHRLMPGGARSFKNRRKSSLKANPQVEVEIGKEESEQEGPTARSIETQDQKHKMLTYNRASLSQLRNPVYSSLSQKDDNSTPPLVSSLSPSVAKEYSKNQSRLSKHNSPGRGEMGGTAAAGNTARKPGLPQLSSL